jgi:hypothetical protein
LRHIPTLRLTHRLDSQVLALVLALGASLGATAIYFESVDEEEAVMSESVAWMLVTSLVGAFVGVALLFLLLINSKYRRTFYSTQTSKEWVCSYFTKDGASDESKMKIHLCRRAMWKHIREEVKEWTLANWERIEAESPEWFTPALKDQIDDDMIPAAVLRKIKMAGGGSRRRSSMSQRLMGEGSRREVEGEGGGGDVRKS